jgi:arabinofuranan 3-O-arabinosyltransferase
VRSPDDGGPQQRVGAGGRRSPRRPPIGLIVLAAVTYLPALTAAPGRMPTDTKLSLYLDPGRLVADAPFTWDTRQFAGWVPHQTIAYLWPSGPWFWMFDRAGIPDWIAHRLWLGTLLFLGGLGVRWAARQLGLDARAAATAGIVYALSPYVLPYVSRTSVMLLPWMGLGWLVGLTVRATVRTRWRDVGLFGLVVLTIGAVNATALALVAPAPALWLLHAAWQRSITWRTAVVTAAKLGGISLVVSMWWIVMLVVQGRHGADVLAYSETLDAVSLTSVSTETLRGLGYWLFYVRDPYAFTTTAAIEHLGSTWVILAGYLLVALGLAGLALIRWSQRRFAAWMFAAGIVLAVGVHPIEDPSPLMAPLRDSALGLALRSSTRALPLSAFGLAMGIGVLVTLASRARVRGRALGGVASAALVVLAVVGVPAATSGGYVDPALERDQDVPGAWDDAVAVLDAGSSEFRVMQLPGSEFGAFRWGYTVDPPLPGLTDRPLVTRDLLPLGSPGAMDLLYALDNRIQAGTVDPDAIAPVARLFGADTIWVANDLAFDRFRTPRPEIVSELFAAPPAGLGVPVAFGDPVVNVPDVEMLDEQGLVDARVGTPLAPVELVPVQAPQSIVRVVEPDRVVVLAGSGDGVVDAAAAGLLDGTEAVVYAADLAAIRAAEGVAAGAGAGVPGSSLLVVTDSNRDRAAQWRGSQDVSGFTERGGPERDLLREDSSDQRLQVFDPVDPAQQTVAVLDDGLEVSATGYGEPFALRPEDRPAMAVDGDPTTAWRVADRADPRGQRIEVSTTDGTLRLLQQQVPTANRRITGIEVVAGDGEPQPVVLDERSLTAPGQDVAVPPGARVSITITAVADLPGGTDSGRSAVGFAEIGPVARETVRLPTAAFDGLDDDRPVAIVLTRERVRPTNRWRSDPEPALDRTIVVADAGGLALSGPATITLRRNDRAPDDTLDALAAASGATLPRATSNRRLTGVAEARAVAAVDADPGSAWFTPFGQAVGSAITVTTTAAATGPLTLVQPVGTPISPITRLTFTDADGTTTDVEVPPPDATGASTLVLPTALPAGPLTVTVAAVEPRTTVDRRWGEPVQTPAAISELGGLALQPAPAPDLADCRTDLLAIDGTPVGVAVPADAVGLLAAGGTVRTTWCGAPGAAVPTDLAAGEHRITTAAGLRTGIDVDQVVLRSGPADAFDPSTRPAPRPAPDVTRTRTERHLTVDACPQGCWVVLGEGHNRAWLATVDGEPLGEPVQIAGGFNGWWLPPAEGAREVTMRWTPQAGLNVALLVALLGVLASVALAVADRRIRTTVLPTSGPDLTGTVVETLTAPDPVRRRLLAAAVLVAGSALVIAPEWGLVALLPAAVLVWSGRTRTAAVAAAVLTGALGLVVAWRQYHERFFPDAGWPANFSDLHRLGLFAVVLLAAGTVVEPPIPSAPAPAPDPATGDAEADPATGDAEADPGDADAAGDAPPAQESAAATTEPAR